MKAKRLVIAGVGVAAILGGTAVVLDQMTAGEPSTSQAVAPAGSSPPAAVSTADPGTTDATAAPTGAADSAPSPTGGSTDGSSAAPAGREVLPPVSAAPTGLPAPSPPASLISMPLPAAASAQGKIVDGFPADALRFPEGTVVGSTSVSPAEESLQVAADGIASLSQDSVAGHFQQVLGGLGFWSEPVPAAAGERALRFGRGADSVTLTASTTGTGGTRFMLLGNLHAAAGG
ncbi:hypothetical protein NicSoilB4_22430 [Arthrobacter sp. NicSoilB4]|uniref:hypothetical protein n=1 Tax=Arthrobacter sp. NicSoilB4 TaxID=2830997 RepID=UPI001CC418D1|nr:hypothetical protein [Arthrobacter sp. NicSoilB4]BCW67480.1 hypothetical protein NicSoilB4_22430 [Arthrobacter sp. NicSoilB4]